MIKDTGSIITTQDISKSRKLRREKQTQKTDTPQCRATDQEYRGNAKVNLKQFASVYMINVSHVKILIFFTDNLLNSTNNWLCN